MLPMVADSAFKKCLTAHTQDMKCGYLKMVLILATPILKIYQIKHYVRNESQWTVTTTTDA